MRPKSDSLVNLVTRTTVLDDAALKEINDYLAKTGRAPIAKKIKRPEEIHPSRDEEKKHWQPTEDGATIVSIRGLAGSAMKIREYLLGKFARVHIWFIYEIGTNFADERDYVFKCWLKG